jgi:hypothetical protein
MHKIQLLFKLIKIHLRLSLPSKTQKRKKAPNSPWIWFLWMWSIWVFRKPNTPPSSPSTPMNLQKSARSCRHWVSRLLLRLHKTLSHSKLRDKLEVDLSSSLKKIATEKRTRPKSKWQRRWSSSLRWITWICLIRLLDCLRIRDFASTPSNPSSPNSELTLSEFWSTIWHQKSAKND